MATQPHIRVEGLSKKFARSLKRSFIYGAQDIARVATGRGIEPVLRESEFWALRNVSFDLEPGQATGIVGINGSGKTTLLRLVSGILAPTEGTVTVNGTIAPMLALGAGFKPVLSGRENVYLNMSLLGLSRAAIKAKFDEVVDFAELWEAIDAPLGTYSTGMHMRLGFSCAVHTDPQILIVDEVLSVGDAKFRAKCRNRINELRRAGTSMLLVSHSAISLETLTDECIYLKRGEVVAKGEPAQVLQQYNADMLADASVATSAFSPAKVETRSAAGNGAGKTGREKVGATIASIRLVDEAGFETGHWTSGRSGALEVVISAPTPVADVSLNVIVIDMSHDTGANVQFLVSRKDVGTLQIGPGATTLGLKLDPVVLRPGKYRLKISVSTTPLHDILDAVDNFPLLVARNANGENDDAIFQPRGWLIDGVLAEVQKRDLGSVENVEEF